MNNTRYEDRIAHPCKAANSDPAQSPTHGLLCRYAKWLMAAIKRNESVPIHNAPAVLLLRTKRTQGRKGEKDGLTTKVNQSQIKNKLRDLHDGNVSLPPDLVTSSSSPVVVVHDNMY